jgi:O-antigen/teichoic acid export membrane protein
MIAFVNIAYSLGLEPAYMRFYVRDDATRSAVVFGTSYRMVLLLAAVVTGVTILFAGPIGASTFLQLNGDAAMLVTIAACIPLFDALVLMPYAKMRMDRTPRRFAALRLLNVALNVIFNVVFVIVLGWRVEGVLWAGVLSGACTFVFFVPDVMHALRERFDAALAREMLRFGLPTVPSSISAIMVQVADRPIMLMLVGNAAVGMYQTNFRLALPMMLVVTVFEYAWKPFYLHHRDDADAKAVFARVLTLFTVACGVVFLATALFMPYVVTMPFVGGRFINPQYWSGLSIVPIVLFAYFFNGVFTNLAAGFHIAKRMSFFPLATGVAAAINVGSTFLLVPVMGIEGAAWAKVAAYAASVMVLAAALTRIYPVRYDVVRVTLAVLIAAAIYGGVLMLPADATVQLAARIAAIPAYVASLLAAKVIGTSTLRTLTSLLRR